MNLSRTGLLATTMIAGLAIFAPSLALAQTTPPQQSQQQQQEEDEADDDLGEVVVTGSRIRRTEYTSSQPIQVITAEQATLEGLADTTEILQSSTAANTATQINNFFTGFVTTGGPGVNTISLRGLGEQRTLVLLNGRRAGPAGVRGTVGPTDLNTIPGSLIERIEILTDGASSIYGSDAVAGVINIITKQNIDGGSVEAFVSAPFEGGGEEIRLSGSFGEAYDRGYVSAGLDYYERKEVLFGDREYFRCPEDRFFLDPEMTIRRDVLENGEYKCDFTLNSIIRTQLAGGAAATMNRRDGDYIFDPTAVQGGGFTGCDMPGFRHVAGGFNSTATPGADCSITASPTALRRAAYSVYPLYNDRYEGRTAISPVKRYSFAAFGGYDLNATTELFGEFLVNRRESEQRSFRQLFPLVSPFHTANPFGGPFNGTTNTFGAGYFATPVALVNSDNDQQVNYIRGVAGLRGEMSFANKSWDWELVAQYSKSHGVYGGNFFYNDRVEATAGYAAAFNYNAQLQPIRDANGNVIPGSRPFGASAPAGSVQRGNCDTAILISATSCPAGGISWFSRDFVENGVLPADQMAFLQGYEQGTTDYTHAYIEGVISGELLTLPAGTVGAALGFHMRREEIDDTPGPEQIRNNLWGSTSAGRTAGSDTVKEVFAELEIPVLANMPLAEKVNLNVSGRFSDYDSYGSNSTYKVGLNWQFNDQIRLRASHGTSFRAPALYEQFLGAQTSFAGQTTIDPCVLWGQSTNTVLRANCAAAGVPDTYNAGGSSSAVVTARGGADLLDPETAKATTVGLIWTPSFADLSIAVDYFEIEVSDQVQQFGAATILSACYNSDQYPNDPLCSLFVRDNTVVGGVNGPRRYQIISVDNDYKNIASQFNKGLDLNWRYRREFAAGDLTVSGRVSHILDWTQQVFVVSTPTVLNSRIGRPETVGELNFRFDRGDWTGNWSVDYVGPMDNDKFQAASIQGERGTFLGENGYFKRTTDEYLTHSISLRRRMDKWTLQAGIQNLFNENPPYLGLNAGVSVIGNVPLVSQYDWSGRTGFISISRSF